MLSQYSEKRAMPQAIAGLPGLACCTQTVDKVIDTGIILIKIAGVKR